MTTTLSTGALRAESLPLVVADEVEQLIASIQTQFNTGLPGPIQADDAGHLMSLLIGLSFAEELPETVREELDQLIAAVQTVFNAKSPGGTDSLARLLWIRTIQRGTITLSGGVASNTATLATPVVLANSRLIHLGHSSDDASAEGRRAYTRLAFTDTTTITASRENTTGTVIVSFEVVEYQPNIIKTVQRGTIALTGLSTAAATITAVSVANTSLDSLGQTTNNTTGSNNELETRLDLTNTTTVTGTRGTNTANVTIGYQAVEWN